MVKVPEGTGGYLAQPVPNEAGKGPWIAGRARSGCPCACRPRIASSACTTGITVLHSLLIDYLKPLDGVTEVALCGNGFTAPRSPHGPFLYADHATLARAANDLQHLFRVHGPRPGEQLQVPSAESPITSSRVGWVKPDTEAERRGLAARIDVTPGARRCFG